MKRLILASILLWSGVSAGAEALPPVVREAMDLELEGRLGEALALYREALSSVPVLVQDEALVEPLTVRVFSKAAHLSIDQGLGEDAWDLGGRLLSAKNQKAAEAGTLVRIRLLRLQEQWTDALALFDDYAGAWPLPPPGPSLLAEVVRIRKGVRKSSADVENLLRKISGPAAWVLDGTISLLPGPTDAWDLSILKNVRLQVGAFKEWGNALTLVNMLRENGWVPFTDVKPGPGGVKLHVVYIISRQPDTDRSRLEVQGLTPLP